jgi:hypothetical protein
MFDTEFGIGESMYMSGPVDNQSNMSESESLISESMYILRQTVKVISQTLMVSDRYVFQEGLWWLTPPENNYVFCEYKTRVYKVGIHTTYAIIVYIYIYIYLFIISIQPLGQFWQEAEPSQATGMALARCILGKFLGVVCHCIPLPLDVSTFADSTYPTTRTLLIAKGGTVGENAETTHFLCHLGFCYLPLYFPYEGRHAEDFFARKIRRLL